MPRGSKIGAFNFYIIYMDSYVSSEDLPRRRSGIGKALHATEALHRFHATCSTSTPGSTFHHPVGFRHRPTQPTVRWCVNLVLMGLIGPFQVFSSIGFGKSQLHFLDGRSGACYRKLAGKQFVYLLVVTSGKATSARSGTREQVGPLSTPAQY
jgi:hypothetical protein